MNVEELIGEVRQRLPMEIRDVLRYITLSRKCILIPDLEEKEHWIQVDRNTYVLINNDFEEFEVVCQEKRAKIPVPSIIYVLHAKEDVNSSKLYIADIDVVEGE